MVHRHSTTHVAAFCYLIPRKAVTACVCLGTIGGVGAEVFSQRAAVFPPRTHVAYTSRKSKRTVSKFLRSEKKLVPSPLCVSESLSWFKHQHYAPVIAAVHAIEAVSAVLITAVRLPHLWPFLALSCSPVGIAFHSRPFFLSTKELEQRGCKWRREWQGAAARRIFLFC